MRRKNGQTEQEYRAEFPEKYKKLAHSYLSRKALLDLYTYLTSAMKRSFVKLSLLERATSSLSHSSTHKTKE
jgi:hypothetical protein